MRFINIILIARITGIFVTWTMALPVLPVIIGGYTLGSTWLGLESGEEMGELVSRLPKPDGTPRSNSDKNKIIIAGAEKGAIDGFLRIPSLILSPVTNMAGNAAAAKTLGIDDRSKVLKGSALAGLPILNWDQGYQGRIMSETLGNHDVDRSQRYGNLHDAGELEAMVQYKDRMQSNKRQS